MARKAAVKNPTGAELGFPIKTPAELWRLCWLCASFVYKKDAPEAGKVDRVARMLFGTAAMESGLDDPDRRQNGFSVLEQRGAWGMWQVETISVRESLRLLARNTALAERAGVFVWEGAAPARWWRTYTAEQLVRAMTLPLDNGRGGKVDPDRMGVAFARLHYLWDPKPIPEDVEGMAAYWKRVYNTVEGAGDPREFVRRWGRLCAPVIYGGAGSNGK